ncbi:pectin lyase-like protein, partial [Coniochaeta ligniaria NRRL 30616]
MSVIALTAVLLSLLHTTTARWEYAPVDRYPHVPDYGPQPNIAYMVDNQHNYYKSAPDKGTQNGAVWLQSGSFENYMAKLRSNQTSSNATMHASRSSRLHSRASSYWLPTLAPKGQQPLAGAGYKMYRDVVKDYKADPTGGIDSTEAINAAIQDGNRCGLECGNTFSTGAVIYFPPGTYKICRPIIQLYYTQFVGDALKPPTIKGCDTFQGIGLIDTDPYIPGGNGQNWYINQNQFFRQIRNFIFDLTDMPLTTDDNGQPLAPTGIHWQVSQACSLQNLVFNMPVATDSNKATHVGIFMENGSGGFVSDLVFNGGSIGWRAGSQQYTAINLKFKGCLTAVQMVWDWGFNWQRIEVDGSAIAFNISGRGGDTGQGIGSVSIIDSKITNCPIGILTNSRKDAKAGPPAIVIDNLEMSNVAAAVQDEGGAIILAGSSHVDLWATGRRYNGTKGSQEAGAVDAPPKAARLLKDGKLFYRPRPQYETVGIEGFLVATDEGCRNDGTGDQAASINVFLQKAKAAGKIAFFPAGIYTVGGTVQIPTGSRVQGSLWSQIQGGGLYFNDINNPKVVVQVGNRGDVGSVEIVEMMFTVTGATAGAIVVEWNVHEETQGSAAMWDTHVRVGGAAGTNLDSSTCAKFGFSDNCICASLLFHVTPQASGYFENAWIWLADHDNDMSVYDSPDKVVNQISLYAARGTLIESEGPSWFYGTGSEHSVLYQYQVYGAKDIYLGHIQTESPYYQPDPVAPYPFDGQKAFPGDPSFADCKTDSCKAAWGLRVIDSQGVTIHSAGLYSFFQDYYQDCIDTQNCQERIAEVKGSKDVVLFNLFTIASEQVGTGINNGAIFQNDSNQSGFTTEVSVWLPLDGDDNIDVVYVGTEVWTGTPMTCSSTCVLVIPTSSLKTPSVIDPGHYTTSFEYGHISTVTVNGVPATTFITQTTTITITVPKTTVSAIPYSNINITSGQTPGSVVVLPSVDLPPIGIPLPDGTGGTTTRNVSLPPWPAITNGPPDGWGNPTDPFAITGPGSEGGLGPSVYHTQYSTTVSARGPTVITLSFPSTISPMTVNCPPDSTIAFNTPKTTITADCDQPTAFTLGFTCAPTKIVTFLAASSGVFSVDCTLSTAFNPRPGTSPTTSSATTTTTTPLPVWATWPGGIITPVPTPVNKQEPTDDGVVTPCKLWFFSICILRDNIHIGGWHWILPPGIYPPGPPPGFIKFPPGWDIKGTLPPWPRITIGQDHVMTYEGDPEKQCETESASICSTTTSYGVSTTGTITRTTATSEAPCGANAIVYPANPEAVGEIPRILAAYEGKYVAVGSAQAGFTSFYWVPDMDAQTMSNCTKSRDVSYAYYYEEWNANVGPDDDDEDEELAYDTDRDASLEAEGVDRILDQALYARGRVDNDVPPAPFDTKSPEIQNATSGPDPHSYTLAKRAGTVRGSVYWDLPFDSVPPGTVYQATSETFVNGPNPWQYRYDDTAGSGQFVYLLREKGIWQNHDEFTKGEGVIETLGTAVLGTPLTGKTPNPAHGSGCAAKIMGAKLGVCKKCTLVFCSSDNLVAPAGQAQKVVHEAIIQEMDAVLDDIIKKGRVGKATVSMSFSYAPGKKNAQFYQSMRYSLNQLVIKGKAVLVASSNNHAKTSEGRGISRFPALYGDPQTAQNPYGELSALVTVGAVDSDTYEAPFSQYADWMTTFAPGQDVYVPDNPNNGDTNAMRKGSGTSYAAPQVAGLAAYLRSLSSPWQTQLQDPANVKKLIRLLHRRFIVLRYKAGVASPADRKPVVWNGEVGAKSCVADYADRANWDVGKVCPTIDDDLDKVSLDPPPGQTVGSCAAGVGGNPVRKKRQDGAGGGAGGSCPLNLGGGGDGGKTLSFTTGPTAAPTCPSVTGCGGRLCTGYYCVPNPTGVPPDFPDPKDPAAGGRVSSTT